MRTGFTSQIARERDEFERALGAGRGDTVMICHQDAAMLGFVVEKVAHGDVFAPVFHLL